MPQKPFKIADWLILLSVIMVLIMYKKFLIICIFINNETTMIFNRSNWVVWCNQKPWQLQSK
jgi:hypothetical protein